MRILMSETTWDGTEIKARLADRKHLITDTADGVALFECLDLLDHPVVIIETDLPDLNWEVAIAQMRAEHPDMAVIALNTDHSVATTLAALDNGADDVIDRRMRIEEIESRLLSVVSRRAGFAGPIVRLGPLHVDLRMGRVTWGMDRVHLSPSQYAFFELLLLNRGRVVHRNAMMGQLYGIEEGPEPRILDVFLSKLRTQFMAAGAPFDLVQTVRGEGYRLGAIYADEQVDNVTSIMPYIAERQNEDMIIEHRYAS